MKKSTFLAIALAAASVAVNVSAQTLPDPGTTVSGVPVSVQYDDAYSYSVPVLNYLYPTQGWDASAGTGNLDVLITTRSSGQTNPDPFPDPTTNPNTNPISDSWGTAATTGDLLVSDVLNWLMTNFNATVPQFTFDMNDTGGASALDLTAKVDIIDGAGGAVLYTWSMDNLTQLGDGSYDIDQWITVGDSITIPDVMNTCPGDTCTFNNNTGSGKFDFIVYVPTMDLSLWDDDNNLFRVSWEFRNVDDGGEEITMTGRFSPTEVPEPGILGLLALGLLGLAATTRRRQG